MRPFLKSERLEFRPIKEEDYPLITSWMNDGEVTKYMFTGQKPVNIKQTAMILEEEICSGKNLVLMVVDKESKRALGTTGLYEIHPTARKAEFRILIGEKDFWGKGIGTEVT